MTPITKPRWLVDGLQRWGEATPRCDQGRVEPPTFSKRMVCRRHHAIVFVLSQNTVADVSPTEFASMVALQHHHTVCDVVVVLVLESMVAAMLLEVSKHVIVNETTTAASIWIAGFEVSHTNASSSAFVHFTQAAACWLRCVGTQFDAVAVLHGDARPRVMGNLFVQRHSPSDPFSIWAAKSLSPMGCTAKFSTQQPHAVSFGAVGGSRDAVLTYLDALAVTAARRGRDTYNSTCRYLWTDAALRWAVSTTTRVEQHALTATRRALLSGLQYTSSRRGKRRLSSKRMLVVDDTIAEMRWGIGCDVRSVAVLLLQPVMTCSSVPAAWMDTAASNTSSMPCHAKGSAVDRFDVDRYVRLYAQAQEWGA